MRAPVRLVKRGPGATANDNVTPCMLKNENDLHFGRLERASWAKPRQHPYPKIYFAQLLTESSKTSFEKIMKTYQFWLFAALLTYTPKN